MNHKYFVFFFNLLAFAAGSTMAMEKEQMPFAYNALETFIREHGVQKNSREETEIWRGIANQLVLVHECAKMCIRDSSRRIGLFLYPSR